MAQRAGKASAAASGASRERGRLARRKLSPAEKAARQAARQAAREASKFQNRDRPLRRFEDSAIVQRGIAGLMRFVLAWARAVGRERASRVAAAVARRLGPRTRENRLGAANLALAFPEKSDEERRLILSGVWDNLARVTIEYAFIPDILDAFDPDRPDNSSVELVGIEHARALRDAGGPSILFGAHLGNWELNAAMAQGVGLPIVGLYRAPTNPYVAAEIEKGRKTVIAQLIDTRTNPARQVANAMRRGAHIGVIIDQRISDGQLVPFLGRPSLSNPMVGIMARLFDCPVHGSRCIRLPDGRFRIEMTPPLELPRDSAGKIDAVGANIVVHAIIEQWVREHPEQWLWLHDRWRYGPRSAGKQF